jgi:hypothetical protein
MVPLKETTRSPRTSAGSGQRTMQSGGAQGGEVAHLIADIVRRESAQRADRERQQAKPPKGKAPALVVLLAVLVAFGVWNAIQIRRVPLPPPAQVEVAARASIYLTASALDSHRRTRGGLPASLEEAGLDVAGLSYRVEAGRYVLTMLTSVQTHVYREGEDLAPYAAALGVAGES